MITKPSGLKYEDDKNIGGSPIKTGQRVRLNYKVALRLEDLIYSKNLIDTSENREEPVIVKVGAGDMLPGIEEGIMGMGKGNTRLLVIPPELAFGTRGIPGIIPEDATVYVEINVSTKAV